MMLWTDHDLTGWGWVAMTISMIGFWVLLIALAVLLVRGLNRPADSSPGQRPAPEQLLAERFARGEIDEEQYQRSMATLTSSGHGVPTR
jgi:putative membrane protein